jgi:hypothetical protein
MTSNQSEGHSDDPFDGLPLLIPVPRAAKLLGISRAAAYRFASAGHLVTALTSADLRREVVPGLLHLSRLSLSRCVRLQIGLQNGFLICG